MEFGIDYRYNLYRFFLLIGIIGLTKKLIDIISVSVSEVRK
jgi:hypothetical protein